MLVLCLETYYLFLVNSTKTNGFNSLAPPYKSGNRLLFIHPHKFNPLVNYQEEQESWLTVDFKFIVFKNI